MKRKNAKFVKIDSRLVTVRSNVRNGLVRVYLGTEFHFRRHYVSRAKGPYRVYYCEKSKKHACKMSMKEFYKMKPPVYLLSNDEHDHITIRKKKIRGVQKGGKNQKLAKVPPNQTTNTRIQSHPMAVVRRPTPPKLEISGVKPSNINIDFPFFQVTAKLDSPDNSLDLHKSEFDCVIQDSSGFRHHCSGLKSITKRRPFYDLLFQVPTGVSGGNCNITLSMTSIIPNTHQSMKSETSKTHCFSYNYNPKQKKSAFLTHHPPTVQQPPNTSSPYTCTNYSNLSLTQTSKKRKISSISSSLTNIQVSNPVIHRLIPNCGPCEGGGYVDILASFPESSDEFRICIHQNTSMLRCFFGNQEAEILCIRNYEDYAKSRKQFHSCSGTTFPQFFIVVVVPKKSLNCEELEEEKVSIFSNASNIICTEDGRGYTYQISNITKLTKLQDCRSSTLSGRQSQSLFDKEFDFNYSYSQSLSIGKGGTVALDRMNPKIMAEPSIDEESDFFNAFDEGDNYGREFHVNVNSSSKEFDVMNEMNQMNQMNKQELEEMDEIKLEGSMIQPVSPMPLTPLTPITPGFVSFNNEERNTNTNRFDDVGLGQFGYEQHPPSLDEFDLFDRESRRY